MWWVSFLIWLYQTALLLQERESNSSSAEQKGNLLNNFGGWPGVKYRGTPADLKARQPEAVRTLLRTMVVEMWAQSGATTVTDMTSIVPTVGHHECKNVEFQKEGREWWTGSRDFPRERSNLPIWPQALPPKAMHRETSPKGRWGWHWEEVDYWKGSTKKWQMSSTWLLHSSLWVEAGLLQMGEISHQWFV